jgi:hypothetical protein
LNEILFLFFNFWSLLLSLEKTNKEIELNNSLWAGTILARYSNLISARLRKLFHWAQTGRFCRQRGTHCPPAKIIGVVPVMAISVTNVSAVTVTVVVGLPAMKLVAKLRKRPLIFGFLPPFAGTSSAINKELSIASFLSRADGTAVIKILFVPIQNLKNGAKFKKN